MNHDATAIREAQARRNFDDFSRGHVLTVLRDDGLYRHVRMATPGTNDFCWEIVTWPGHLAIDGDIDAGHIFKRLPDMFQFFRSGKDESINPFYWAEKIRASTPSIKEYSPEIFMDYVEESLEEATHLGKERVDELLDEAREVAETEDSARDWLRLHDNEFTDAWEWDLSIWDASYLYCCLAIARTIYEYDKLKSLGLEPATPEKALSAIKELHTKVRERPSGRYICECCMEPEYGPYQASWPCETAQAWGEQ